MPRRTIRRTLAALARRVPGEWGLRRGPEPLVRCPACGTDRVCLVEWEESDDTHWWIRLRCGECAIWRDVVASDAEATQLDQALTRHAASIRRALVSLDLERMAAEVDVLVAALERDLIDPSSFAT
jgi:hypothetical protein